MKLRRTVPVHIAGRENESIEEFYAATMSLDHAPDWRECGRMMVELVQLLERHELSFEQKVYTSLHNLSIGPAYVSAWRCRYTIQTGFPGDDKPWQYAMVKWHTNSAQLACDIILQLFHHASSPSHASGLDELRRSFFLEPARSVGATHVLQRIAAQDPQTLEAYYGDELRIAQASLLELRGGQESSRTEDFYALFYVERKEREVASMRMLDLLPYLEAEGLGATCRAYTTGEHELDLTIADRDERTPGVTIRPGHSYFEVTYPLRRNERPWSSGTVSGTPTFSTDPKGRHERVVVRDQEQYRQVLTNVARMASIAARRLFHAGGEPNNLEP